MHTAFSPAAGFRRPACVRPRISVTIAVLLFLLATPLRAQAPAPPAEAYGPFNAVFLADGPGLNKTLSPATSLDGLATAAWDRQGSGQTAGQDPILAGHAAWTVAFWFESPEPLQGTTLLAGMGDPAAEDTRFIGIRDNRLGLWLGQAQASAGFAAGDSTMGLAKWHMAAAVSDGERVVLYADGHQVLATSLAQGNVAPRAGDGAGAVAWSCQQPLSAAAIAALRIYREALTAEQVKAMAAAPPEFNLLTYEEASQHWPVQTSAQAGYSAPQDPSTLPRGQSALQNPAAKKPSPEDLHCRVDGRQSMESRRRLAAGTRRRR